ncbi:MAG: transposase, partial [Candidatus Tyrphobacter sp.]
QIVTILHEFDAGTSADELARRHGIHANTIRLWRSKYAGMTASNLARLKQLEAESAHYAAPVLRHRSDHGAATRRGWRARHGARWT